MIPDNSNRINEKYRDFLLNCPTMYLRIQNIELELAFEDGFSPPFACTWRRTIVFILMEAFTIIHLLAQ